MAYYKLLILLFSAKTVLGQNNTTTTLNATTTTTPVPIEDCNCQECKDILEGTYTGSYQYSNNSDDQLRCDSGCFYHNVDTGSGICFCDPGDLIYEDCSLYEDDQYTLAVKALIDSGTCNSTVTSNSSCGVNATSYYKSFTYNGVRVIISSGIPDHEAEHDATTPNPNTRCEQWSFVVLPMTPVKTNRTGTIINTGLGVVGLAVTGGSFYNHLSSLSKDVAMANEGESLDSCFGHSDSSGTYHYHANINCSDAGAATGANDPDKCLLVGYYLDGVPMYGLCKDANGTQYESCYQLIEGASTVTVNHVGGNVTSALKTFSYEYTSSADCNLDDGNGAIHPTTGQYSYFLTTGYPWVPIYNYGIGETWISQQCALE